MVRWLRLIVPFALFLVACDDGATSPPGGGAGGAGGAEVDEGLPDASVSRDQGALDDLGPDPDQAVPDASGDACAPADEVCNGLDEDCDGVADEGTDGGACEGNGEGLCARGRLVCADGELVCEPPVPGVESCNGLDDDCDGDVDEEAFEGSPECETGRPGACAAGTRICDAEGGVVCIPEAVPVEETCNGVDDDCDGQVDEGDPGGGLGCQLDGPGCQAGTTACVDGAVTCAPGEPGAEQCNGVDDDCDDAIDEAIPPGDCATGQPGICAVGVRLCVAGDIFCEPLDGPRDEVCNGLDDDCDGNIDEDDPGAGPCDTGAAGACGAGQRTCANGRLRCDPIARPDLESCNGLDDDCDGATDEADPNVGLACDAGDAGGACVAGRTICRDGALACAPGEGGAEQCNGADDDCDGETDEAVAVDRPCATGLLGACAAGLTACDAGATLCVTLAEPTEERCNGIDDDCDGSTDEFAAEVGEPCGTGQFGACAVGTVACVDGAPICDPSTDPVPEQCNGADDDCDGNTDEGEPESGRACNPAGADAAECLTGATACADGAVVCVPGPAGFERCDGADDDCDGRVDEQVPQGGACDTGEPGVCATGGLQCLDGALICRPQARPSPESCNGLDDDCDGLIDEDTRRACDTGGVGGCAAGVLTCTDGIPSCAPVVGPGPETCDGTDEDCDGATDEGGPEEGLACDAGAAGQCQAGATVCVDGALDCRPGEPGAEQCNGDDDDCDGNVDEGVRPTPCNTGRPGRCRAGTQVCAGGEASCESDLGPLPETCNGTDDDCDGRVDEETDGAGCATGRPGACAAGVLRCIEGAPSCVAETEPGAEVCNGADDDCDGSLDEGEPGAGNACDPGGAPGMCAAGRTTCLAGSVVCLPGEPDAEACNGADDDCDGQIDEDTADGACETGRPGVCAAGALACVEGATVCLASAEPAAETCDGRDEDCDGTADEGLLDGGGCDTGRPGRCGAGRRVCVEGAERCIPTSPPGDELCNGEDDDCDGQIDEGEPEAGAACDRGMGDGACMVGVTACTDGVLTCEPGEGGAEACNGRDDDCDEAIDEDVAAGERCLTGVPGVCATGTTACADGATRCDPSRQPAAEACNGLDDDCDGRADESTGGDGCDTGALGVCRAGVVACRDGMPECDPTVAPSNETCNGLDDDCDGRTDEGGPGAGRACDPGGGVEGECRTGTTACDGGALVCVPGAPGAEVCNGIDDDCDGTADEGAGGGGNCDTGQPGLCRVGQQRCVAGATVCVPEQTPAAEICDGADQDCDGAVDEETGGGACQTGAAGICSAGVVTCMNGAAQCMATAEPADEACNGLDDDCDGSTDEGDPEGGEGCDPGGGVEGECRTGSTACVDGAVECQAGEPGVESCNGVDDDCDGNADEDIDPAPCLTGQPGVCRNGTRTCVDGADVCAPDRAPGPEQCNGLDDDCDGRTDEGEPGAGPCDTGAEGICAAGALVCRDGVLNCAPQADPAPETCNGLDDDCDGAADEGEPGGGVACDPGGGVAGECQAGATACVAGSLVCQAGAPGAESCNGADDDCDGNTDEDVPTGADCDTGQDGLCAPGTTDCRGGAIVCVARRAPAGEVCNGLDDDCDGRVDEGTGGAACDTGEDGPCGVGTIACRDGNPVCEQRVFAAAEACNALDDDCDGSTDEGNPEADQACDPGGGVAGECRTGSTDCVAGALVCTAGAPGAEVCNGSDDDCDGDTDEEVPVVACDTGRSGICGPGTTTCLGGVPGCRQTAAAAPEACNGLDDDCDGRVDEGNPGAGPCDTGDPGVCAGGTLTCLAGELSCVALQAAGPEQCNLLDDDCDGTTDEGDPQGGQACDVGGGVPGECRAGVTACVGGAVLCEPEGQGAETCNGLDDDCDGNTDEEVPEGADCDTGRPGACAPGVSLCRNGARVCEAEQSPAQETCDGVDEDCDGTTDEGNPQGGGDCDTGRPGVCGPGTEICRDGAIACVEVSPAGPEQCNGLDDDCDGDVDEGDPGGGQGCGTGESGVCAAGTTVCRDGALACDRDVNPQPETCDGVDEDCDGATDEGDPQGGGACNTGEAGLCAAGTESCQAGRLVCVRDGAPSPETCDGADEDCDGDTDEGNPEGGAPCATGEQGACGPGTEQCRNGAIACVRNTEPAPETCDGADEDCDGDIDEGDPGGGVDCDTGVPGLCAAGVTACRRGAVACLQPIDPVPETCDGADEDCDGSTDEGNPEGGGACDTGQQGVCAAGTEACQGGAVACVRNVAPGPERCNGLDDDCDGDVDEGDPEGGAACVTGQPGVCSAGTEQCQNGAIVCARDIEPSPEVCDGVDQDCDGTADNGNPGGNVACDSGEFGLCAAGLTVCRAGAIACDAQAAPVVETCDNQDEDCDGDVDEGNPEGGAACVTGAPGVCSDGTETCQGGLVLCVRDTEPSDEVCNGLDDDCDTRTDELQPTPCPTGLVGQCGLGLTVCTNGESRCEALLQPGDACEEEGTEIDEDCDGRVDERPDILCLPPEIQLVQQCLPGSDLEVALSMAVDDIGTPHLARVGRVGGELLYTVVDVDGGVVNELVEFGISRVGIDETDATDIIFFEGQPAICYRDADARNPAFKVALRTGANQWSIETVVGNDGDAGRYCALGVTNGALVAAYQNGNQLHLATRQGANNWATQIIDRPANSVVGNYVDMAVFNNFLVIAHHDSRNGTLRITSNILGFFGTAFTNPGVPAGFRPSVVVDPLNVQLVVAHGSVPDDPDNGSDGLFYVTTGVPGIGQLQNTLLDDIDTGGWNVALVSGETPVLFTRQRQRSALFGDRDALNIFLGIDAGDKNELEAADQVDRRSTYLWLSGGTDAFGLPMLSYSNRQGALFGQQGQSLVCLYRPLDTDSDRLPDSVELEIGTDPAVADSDGDGVDDGTELLIDGTDPTQP